MDTDLAVATQQGGWWIGRLSSGLVTQGRTVDELAHRLDDLAGLDTAAADLASHVVALPVRLTGRRRRRRIELTASGHELVAALQRLRYGVVERTGVHVALARPTDGRTVVVPLDAELAGPTIEALLREAAVTVGELHAVL